MDSSFNPTAPSEAHPETMDFLSSAWCNFAVQALQPELLDQSMVILDNQIKKLESNTKYLVRAKSNANVIVILVESKEIDNGYNFYHLISEVG